MNRIRDAFDAVRASDRLKADTLEYVLREAQKRDRGKPSRRAKMRFVFASAACALLLFSGAISYHSYFTATAFLDFDINPSIELSVNRFGRVIEARAYNDDGEKILAERSLKHKTYRGAAQLIVDAAVAGGYLQNEALLSVTVQTNDAERESRMLASVEAGVALAVSGHHITPRTEVFSVSADVRNEAHEQDISPAKYLAILELRAFDPAATAESCRDRSIGEIRELTQTHAGNHRGGDTVESGGNPQGGASTGTGSHENDHTGGHD
jgi:hypothetical protein